MLFALRTRCSAALSFVVALQELLRERERQAKLLAENPEHFVSSPFCHSSICSALSVVLN